MIRPFGSDTSEYYYCWLAVRHTDPQGGDDGEKGEEGERPFKTNLARLLRRGDDWDEEGLMSEADMLRQKVRACVFARLLIPTPAGVF